MSVYGALCDTPALIRQAQAYLREIAAQRQPTSIDPAAAGASMLCRTATDGNYPTTATAVYVLTPLDADCADSEGATASYTGDTDSNFYGPNIGSQVPPQGTTVIAHGVGGRWVFRYDG